MTYPIGFAAEQLPTENPAPSAMQQQTSQPRRSLVRVRFPEKGMPLTYYNDQFDLHCGDIVFVDGKLEGLRGYVVEVNYNFKIKLSEYQRVIAVADTEIHGKFYMAGSHFVTFDPTALPVRKAASWYLAPPREEDYASGTDASAFPLNDLRAFPVGEAIANRGRDYYLENKVVYLCIDGSLGYAIVEGSRPYAVEFRYADGEISGLVCDCPYGGSCKHQVAAMLQLRETLELIETNHASEYQASGYFAAVSKPALFAAVIDSKTTGAIVL